MSDLPLGVYRGALGAVTKNGTVGPAGAGVLAYEAWLGRRATYVLDYVTDKPVNWTTFEQGVLWGDVTKRLADWAGFAFDGRIPMIGLPACSGRSAGSGGGTWAQEAAGTNDAHWTALGNRLISLGMGNAVLRIGREFNYGGYDWSPSVTGDTVANYIAGYRHVVNLLRGLSGAHFTFMWNPATPTGTMVGQAGSAAEVQTWYPGDAYVDSIGLDVYDWGGYSTLTAAPFVRSQSEQNQSWRAAHVFQQDGLNSWFYFAGNHEKPLSFPEWGLELWLSGSNYYGGGDNPSFIQRMYGMFNAVPVPLHSVAMWEDVGMGLFDDDGIGARQGGIAPTGSRVTFLTLFGGLGDLGLALNEIDSLVQALSRSNDLARRLATS